MFDGYHRAPELTGSCIRDGWFASGDLGYIAAGQLYVTGRKTDLIIVGGRKFHPEELEQIADSILGLAPGRSVAFGVDDQRLGSDRMVMICELAAPANAEQQRSITRQLRTEVTRQTGATLGEVHLVARGWVLKTSSGKTSRVENRRKYLAQHVAGELGRE
jgi:acyl-CoA synthetase (AMP-forming)/AMP-acid ligase II